MINSRHFVSALSAAPIDPPASSAPTISSLIRRFVLDTWYLIRHFDNDGAKVRAHSYDHLKFSPFTLYLLQIAVFDEYMAASVPPPMLTWCAVWLSALSSNATCSSGKNLLALSSSSRHAAFSRTLAVLGFALLAPQSCRGEAAQRQEAGSSASN